MVDFEAVEINEIDSFISFLSSVSTVFYLNVDYVLGACNQTWILNI